MSALALAGRRAAAPTDRPDPRWAIAHHTAGRALRGALIWGAVFGVWVVATVEAFVHGYPTLAARVQLARSLQGFAMILGVPRRAETVAGFTSWRILIVITVIGAIWGIAASTGALRGEEDAGRWELLLAGQTTRRRAAAQALLGLGAALTAMFVVTAVLTLLAGRLPGARFSFGGSLLFAAAQVSGAAAFLAVGALTSQLAATRGRAVALAAVALGASFALHMVADSRASLGWLRWLTPIGWVEELRPLQDPRPLALVPMIALVAGCAALTVALAGRRDLGAGVLPEGDDRAGPARWLVGPTTLALRLAGPAALAWLGGLAAMALLYGSQARAAGLLTSSPAVAAALGRLGVRSLTEGYLGMVFLILAVVIAALAASQVAALRGEEASGRLDGLLVRPVGRTTWLVGRLLVASGLILAAGGAIGLCAWLGAKSQHVGVALPKMLEAGVNATVPAFVVLGVGALVFGLRPRLSGSAAYGIVVWSFLVDLLGSLIKGSDWLRDSSLFSHMALAPAASPTWDTSALMLLIAVAAAVVGAIGFERRDVEYE